MASDESLPQDLTAAISAAGPNLPAVAMEAAEGLLAAISAKGASTARSGHVNVQAATERKAGQGEGDEGMLADRATLAAGYGRVAAWLVKSGRRRPYELTFLAIAAATLAEAHHLDREGRVRPSCAAALEVVVSLLRDFGTVLRARVRRLLLAILDGIALEGGRAAFVVEARRLLEYAHRWKPTRLDVGQDTSIRLGGNVAAYESLRKHRSGERVPTRIPLAPGNGEGRLVLLIADGRAPVDPPRPVLSRAKGAVETASRGVVSIERDSGGRPRLVPAVELTPRARRAAQLVRSVRIHPRRAL